VRRRFGPSRNKVIAPVGTVVVRTSVGQEVEVGYLQPKDVVRVVDTTGSLTNPQDIPPLGLANLVLLDELEGERMITDLLRRSMESIDKK